jgi:hypothetical protein
VCHYLFRSAENDERRELLHHQHIQRRQEIERGANEARIEEESRSGMILRPQPNDVLVGRGRPYQEYPGNQRLSRFVEAQSIRYRDADDRFEKSCIILGVIKTVHDSNGRFLQKTWEGWKVASDKVAREKTCSAFRSKVGKASINDGTSKHSVVVEDELTARNSKRVRYDPSLIDPVL